MQLAPHLSPPPTGSAAPLTRLAGRRLRIARAAWFAFAGLFVTLFVLGAPASFINTLQISDATRLELLARGIAPAFPAYYFITLDTLTFVGFAVTAFFIVSRQPDDWMAMLTSLAMLGTGVIYTIPIHEAPVPFGVIAFAKAMGEIFQIAFLFLFPIGQFIPRWLGWLIIPMFVWRPTIWFLSYMPHYLSMPRTAETFGTLRQDGLDTALMLLLFVIGISAQGIRYRRVYNATQKLQTKWVLWGISIAILVAGTYVVILNAFGLLLDGGANALLWRMIGRTLRQLALFMVPLTLAFSVLRYRLWDIDVLLQRTLIYAPLTAILAGIFAALVPFGQTLAIGLTGHESIVVTMIATMVLVAVAEPLRQTLQEFVDKKIIHAPDPQRHLEKFNARIQKRLAAVRPNHLLRRFTDQAVQAFQAQGGTLFLERGSARVMTYTRGDANTDFVIHIRAHGKRIGAIALAPRADQRPYSKRDRAMLEKTAAVVGMAIEQDSNSS